MNIFDAISSLVNYGLENDFFEKQDKIYYINKYMHVFGLDDFSEGNDSFNIKDVIEFCISYCNSLVCCSFYACWSYSTSKLIVDRNSL